MQPELSRAHTAEADDLRSLLRRDHDHLERLFAELLSSFEADARTDIARLWNQFDHELRAHLTLEEEQLVSKFVDFNAPEALALLREHQSIRNKLLQLGVGVDLHLTRHEQVEDFVRELRAHGKREDALMYRWIDDHVDDGELRRSIRQRIAQR